MAIKLAIFSQTVHQTKGDISDLKLIQAIINNKHQLNEKSITWYLGVDTSEFGFYKTCTQKAKSLGVRGNMYE